MTRRGSGLRAAALGVLALGLSVPVNAGAEPPELPLGTWHVLIHYRAPGGPDPDRWLWDERIWVIEAAGDDLAWTEHAIISLIDPAGRFENLGTNFARRLTGAWTPNPGQRQEIATGLTVDSRGMRSKHLEPVGTEPGSWTSQEATNRIGRSAGGVGYHEVWSIASRQGKRRFEMESRFELQAEAESGGHTRYDVEALDGDAWTGRYTRGTDRVGRFRLVPAQILVVAADAPRDPPRRPKAQTFGSVELVPDRQIHTDVPLVFTLLRYSHYYGDRTLTIESTPAGAELDFAYLRRGTQLLYRRGRAPLVVNLPTRLQTHPQDRLLIRGFIPGYERARESFAVAGGGDRLQLDFVPLPNQLRGVAHGHVAGRSVLEFITAEEPSVRMGEDAGGFSVVFLRTGLEDDLAAGLDAFRDPLFGIQARQLGEDLVVRLATPERERLALRHEVRPDAARGEFRTRLLVSDSRVPGRVARIQRAVRTVASTGSRPCASRFESVLRADLEDGILRASLGRDDHAERATLRAALRGLVASRPDHRLSFGDATPLAVASPLEFELAWSRRTQIEGYLKWLHDLAGVLDPESDGAGAFRSWIAPGLAPDRFDPLLERAVAARRACEDRL